MTAKLKSPLKRVQTADKNGLVIKPYTQRKKQQKGIPGLLLEAQQNKGFRALLLQTPWKAMDDYAHCFVITVEDQHFIRSKAWKSLVELSKALYY